MMSPTDDSSAGGGIQVTLDSTVMNQALRSLSDAMLGAGKDITTLLVDEHRRLTRTIVNFTAPMPRSGARQRGEAAVKRDIHSIVKETSPKLIDAIGSRYGITDVKTDYVTRKGEHVLINWDHIDPTGARLDEYHRMHLDRKGHAPRTFQRQGEWRARVMVPYGAREAYVKKIQSHVGRWKAKWAFAAAKAGDNYPKWISRHFADVAGDATGVFELQDPATGNITFGGRGMNFHANLEHVKGAMAFRAKTIMRRVKLMVNGYREDLVRGMRAQTQAHKHRGGQQDPVE